MEKVELTYAEMETLLFILSKLDSDYYIGESMLEKVFVLKIKLTAMRNQLEYLKVREE
jgi:hypothetical protein